MLGVGLHSYGFMDAAFKWLLLFVVSQGILMALAFLPARYCRSQAFQCLAPKSASGPMRSASAGKGSAAQRA
jgi:hypothetical protein